MRPIAGTYGNITADEYLHAQRIEHTADGLAVTWFDGSTITLPDRAPKIDLPAIPAAFRRNVWKRRAGGGAANSRIAAGFIAEAVGGQNEIRHLDGNRFDASIASELPPPARSLAIRESPTNYVFSARGEAHLPLPPRTRRTPGSAAIRRYPMAHPGSEHPCQQPQGRRTRRRNRR